VKKYLTAGQDAGADIIQRMHFTYQIIKAQKHTRNMQRLMLFHIKYQYMNVLQ